MRRTKRIDRDLLVRTIKLLKQAGNTEVFYNPEFAYGLFGAATDLEKVLGDTVQLPDLPGPPDPPRSWKDLVPFTHPGAGT